MAAEDLTDADEIKARAMRGESSAPKAAGRGRARAGSAQSQRSHTASAPPVADPSPEESAPKKLTPTMRTLREGVLDIYTAAEMAAFMLDPFAAQCIGQQKEKAADAWIELAQRDKRVADMLRRLTTGSAWGGLIMAHAGMVLPILAQRGIIPGGALFGGGMMNAATPMPGADEIRLFEDDEVSANGAATFS